MTKLLALATAIILAAASCATTAQAGMRIGVGIGVGGLALGALGAMAHSNRGGYEVREYRHRKKWHAARRERQEKTTASKKSKSETTRKIAKQETTRTPQVDAANEASSIAVAGEPAAQTTGSVDPAAQTENSSISFASANDAPAVAKVETVRQQGLDCKKFFPSVGLTLSVPCE